VLEKQFKLKSTKDIVHLGIKILHKLDGTLQMLQEHYVNMLLDHFNVGQMRERRVPITQGAAEALLSKAMKSLSVLGAMFTRVKSADTPVTPTKENSNTRGVSTSSLCMPSIKPIIHVMLVCKRVGGWEKLIEPLSPPFSIEKCQQSQYHLLYSSEKFPKNIFHIVWH
jgi:hypothetical protein